MMAATTTMAQGVLDVHSHLQPLNPEAMKLIYKKLR